ncbi:MAG: hypothetical protein K6C34_01980 [Alphaproteobacteria bacterium]|nr:hypothetical protein [Alphaproteobacteria bacterium]
MLIKVLGICFCMLFEVSIASEMSRRYSFPTTQYDPNFRATVTKLRKIEKDIKELHAEEKEEKRQQKAFEASLKEHNANNSRLFDPNSDSSDPSGVDYAKKRVVHTSHTSIDNSDSSFPDITVLYPIPLYSTDSSQL